MENGIITIDDIVAEIESADRLLKFVRKNRNRKDLVISGMLQLLTDNAVIVAGLENAEVVADDIRELMYIDVDIPQDLIDYWLFTLNGVVSRCKLAVNQTDIQVIEVSNT